jgi:hypothetical protein
MNWIVAGLIAGIIAYLADWVLWTKVFTKGMDAFAVMPAAGQPMPMGSMMAQSAALALAFGIILAFLYGKFRSGLWVGPGPLAGMELATVLWLPIALANLGSGVWYARARPLLNAQMWAWLIRMNIAGGAVGLLMK